ncbi:right-handed parallel beta-helix repeat-containing protein [Luteolibacter marinus]|uniref:right-handed parallel beta-helix repeat-containing protein n=1 Tax=Luteolibacter marinus TaxID=2776705 RepID=UPI0018676634|nr:right-handed parallel beta-helix repeat-containing protein [Luteolibacter marinus]
MSCPGACYTVALLSLLIPAATQAAILRVDPGAAGSNNGSSWANAYSSLQTALANASPGDEIWVAAGSYKPTTGSGRTATFSLASGVALYGGFAGTETLREERDFAANTTTLSGNIGSSGSRTDNSYHVVTADGVNASTILDGFTVRAGHADGTTPHDSAGGIRILNGASPQITNCRIVDNQVDENGGAVGCDSSSPTLTNCELSGNRAGRFAGGFYNVGTSTATFVSCTFAGNIAANTGGAIHNSSTVDFDSCLVWNNSASGVTNTIPASIYNSTLSTRSFDYCLFQNYDLTSTGTGNLNGTLGGNNPLFLSAVSPALAPNANGDYQTDTGSPVVNQGNDAANPEALALEGNRRKIGTIDIGAYERQIVVHVDKSVPVSGDGSTWANAFKYLRDALNATGPGYEVWIAEGTHYPDERVTPDPLFSRDYSYFLPDGCAIYGGFPAGGGDGTFGARDFDAYVTILSGDVDQNDTSNLGNRGDNVRHVINSDGDGPDTLLSGVTIKGGAANDNPPFGTTGGGLTARNGSEAQFIDCIFIDNFGSTGGGVYVNASSPTFTRCRLERNFSGAGGGLRCDNGATPVFHACNILANYNSAGIYVVDSSPGFFDCLVTGNQSTSNGGGAYIQGSNASPTFVNVTFSGNRTTGPGGGFSCYSDATPTFLNCLIWNNRSSQGTGVPLSSIHHAFDATPNFSHCIVENLSKADLDSSGASPDTNYNPADPLFVTPLDPGEAPSSLGDFRLFAGSAALNLGSNADNPYATDFEGGTRIEGGTIDLGAHEGNVPTTFDLMYPALDPDEDDNGNGISNRVDYSVGANPTAPHDPSLYPALDGSRFNYGYRAGAADVIPLPLKSPNLEDWFQMLSGTDYTPGAIITSGGRTLVEIDLLIAPPTPSRQFYRVDFITSLP